MRVQNITRGAVLAFLLSTGSAFAQTYDPDTASSPLILTDMPADGVAYFETLQRARAAVAARDWATAEPLLEHLTQAYTRDGHIWMMLGATKEGLGKYDEAVEAWRRAGPLIGWDLEYANGYNIAIDQYRGGHRDDALASLRWMVFEEHGFFRERLFAWNEFAPLRTDPEFLEIVGRPDVSGWTREQGWAHDITHLYNEVKRVNPDYRHQPFPAEFERRYSELLADAPRLSDEEIFFGMQRMLAVLNQGHLTLWADHTARTPNRFLPLRLYAFPDGVYIIGADDAHQHLIGARIERIGELTAEEAYRRLGQSMSLDGDMALLWQVSRLAETYNLRGMGAIEETDEVDLVLRRGNRRQRVTVRTLAQSMPGRQDRLVAPPRITPPLWLSQMNQTHWVQLLPDHDAIYVQVNNLRASEDETLPAFGQRLWRELEQARPRNLILDLRHNNGGTTQQYPELLRTLIAFSRVPGNQVYALIGRRSYSATGNLVTDLERLTDPVFVGEASSECCNLYGDPIAVRLPYSNVQGELTAVRWMLSAPSDRRREMSPEAPSQMSAADYFAGRDPVLDTAFELIRRRPAQ